MREILKKKKRPIMASQSIHQGTGGKRQVRQTLQVLTAPGLHSLQALLSRLAGRWVQVTHSGQQSIHVMCHFQAEKKRSPQMILQIPFPALTTKVTTCSNSAATGWGRLSKPGAPSVWSSFLPTHVGHITEARNKCSSFQATVIFVTRA